MPDWAAIWKWLSDPNNQKTAAYWGGGIAFVAGGAWAVIKFFSKRTEPPQTIHHHGITLEEYEKGLKRREQEIRQELQKEIDTTQAEGEERRKTLEAQLTAAQAKLADRETAYEELQKQLTETAQTLETFKPQVGVERIQQAEVTLAQGDTKAAEAVFHEILEEGERAAESAAEAAFRLGKLAEERIEYEAAHRYLHRAAQLQPENPSYLHNAGDISKTLGRYAEAEPLYKRSLEISERALGEDHPDVATTLNNLAGLYRAQGKYGEAEPLYKRSLEISERALGPVHPHVGVVLENYAGLLRETGREAEAEQMEARVRAIREKNKAQNP